nr:hypothetical protein [Tanacetum cinerariifolium]GFA52947.1 hypothetical protein [Tanacetum cinerariifolium]
MLGQHPLAVWSIAADYLVSDRYPGVRSVCNIGSWPNVRAVYGPGRSDNMIKNQWQVLTSLRSKNLSAGVSSSSTYNRDVSVDSANNSSGSTITLFGKSLAINEDTSLPCMNKPPSPSGVTVAYHGDCIAELAQSCH